VRWVKVPAVHDVGGGDPARRVGRGEVGAMEGNIEHPTSNIEHPM